MRPPEGDLTGFTRFALAGFYGSHSPGASPSHAPAAAAGVWLPWEAPRETDSGAGRAEGDGFGPRGVALGGFRGSGAARIPRDGPRETDSSPGASPSHAPVAAARAGSPHPVSRYHMSFVLESCSCEKLLNLIIGFLMTRPNSSENVPSDTTMNARLCTSSLP